MFPLLAARSASDRTTKMIPMEDTGPSFKPETVPNYLHTSQTAKLPLNLSTPLFLPLSLAYLDPSARRRS